MSPHPHPGVGRILATETQQRVAAADQSPAFEIRYGDDAELEALGVVHRHHPDAVVVLGLGGRGGLVVAGAAEPR